MAKKKKSKAQEKESFEYSVELTGLFLILLGIVGFGFGPVGAIIKKFAMFLVGGWAWIFLLLFLILLGCYMLFRRRLPKFLNQRLIGLYVIIIVILVASHFGFIEKCNGPGDIFQSTIDQYMDRINTVGNTTALFTSGDANIEIGGGMIGAIFSVALSSMFGLTGTKIVAVILVIFGGILLFNITLADILNKLKATFKAMQKEDEHKERIEKQEPEHKLYDYEEHPDYTAEESMPPAKDDKIVITSMEELKNMKEEPIKESLEMPRKTYEANSNYALPPLSLLDEVESQKKVNSNNFIRSNKENLERVLNDFQIKGQVVEIHIGPAVTQYEVKVPSGTKVSRISGINKEIALALAAKDVRIQAPIPGKNTIGIEIPNPSISMVKFKEVLAYDNKENSNGKILVALGKDIMGKPQLADLSKMPHLLIAGSTGSGKSVCTNTIICSILMRYKPDEVKLMLVDPKKVELSNYNGIPHLICPVVSDPKKASVALQKLVSEMERRYDLFSDKNVKNIGGYNELIDKENKNSDIKQPRMHYIVAIIDELADLMLVASKEVEDSIMRITQMARAAGIHLIVATQRPSTDVITGVVKANIPSRIAFAVASNIDSRTILDSSGAEKLLGKGDMLYLPMGENVPTRIQGCFINDDEIKRIIDHVCKQQGAQYDSAMENLDATGQGIHGTPGEKEEFDDPMYNEIVEFAIQTGKVSTSLLQRRFRLGYNRAARVVDLLEERGIVGPPNGSKPREVLVKLEDKPE